MKNITTRTRTILAAVAAMLSAATLLTSCVVSGAGVTDPAEPTRQVRSSDIEFAFTWDEDGLLTELLSRNDAVDGILAKYTEQFTGKTCDEVIAALLPLIDDAGYYVEEIEMEGQWLVVELEKGKKAVDDLFIKEIAEKVRTAVNKNTAGTQPPAEPGTPVKPETIYGTTDYGVTDYDVTDYGPRETTPAPESKPAETTGRKDTDYGATDYGTTDYDVTDYGPRETTLAPESKPAETTGRKDTDYGATDYDATDYGTSDYGATDYDATDYGTSDYGISDYDDSDYGR